MEATLVNEMPPTNLSLTVPTEMSQLVSGSDRFELAANEFIVDSEPAFQVADEMQVSLKTEAKRINDLRMDFTRPIDAIKKKWMDFFNPAVEGRTRAATVYQQKMSAYRRQEREKAEAAQRESERLLREEKQRLEAEARKKEEHAQTLKNQKAKQKLLDEAQESRQTAAMVPETVALSAPAPQTVASNVAEVWEFEKFLNLSEFFRWLADHPEWHGVFAHKVGEMNRMAKQFRDAVPVPGVKFHQRDQYRSKSRF